MAGKKAQTTAKRMREIAVKERRDRKRAKKAENAALRNAPAAESPEGELTDETDPELQTEETAEVETPEPDLSLPR